MINEHLYLCITDIIEIKCKKVSVPFCETCGTDCVEPELLLEEDE